MKLFDKAMAGLGVTHLSRVLVALGVVAVLAAAGGVFVGQRWERGAQAIASNDVRQKQIDQLVGYATAQRDDTVRSAIAYRAAAARMDGLASQLEADRLVNFQFFQDQRNALDDLLAKRPDLRSLDLGADVLRHWNKANAGPGGGAGAAPAKPAGQPVGGVPAASPGAVLPDAGAVGQPRPGGAALQPVPHGSQQPDQCGEGMGANRVGLVLRGGRARGCAGGWMRGGANTGPGSAESVNG